MDTYGTKVNPVDSPVPARSPESKAKKRSLKSLWGAHRRQARPNRPSRPINCSRTRPWTQAGPGHRPLKARLEPAKSPRKHGPISFHGCHQHDLAVVNPADMAARRYLGAYEPARIQTIETRDRRRAEEDPRATLLPSSEGADGLLQDHWGPYGPEKEDAREDRSARACIRRYEGLSRSPEWSTDQTVGDPQGVNTPIPLFGSRCNLRRNGKGWV